MKFRKTSQSNGLRNCQIEKLIACLYGPGISKGRQKQKSCGCLVVIGRAKEINETNMAQNFTSNFLNLICLSGNLLMICIYYVYIIKYIYIYIYIYTHIHIHIFVGAKVY